MPCHGVLSFEEEINPLQSDRMGGPSDGIGEIVFGEHGDFSEWIKSWMPIPPAIERPTFYSIKKPRQWRGFLCLVGIAD